MEVIIIATSSIFKNFTIDKLNHIEEFIKAILSSKKDKEKIQEQHQEYKINHLHSPEEIIDFFKKRK